MRGRRTSGLGGLAPPICNLAFFLLVFLFPRLRTHCIYTNHVLHNMGQSLAKSPHWLKVRCNFWNLCSKRAFPSLSLSHITKSLSRNLVLGLQWFGQRQSHQSTMLALPLLSNCWTLPPSLPSLSSDVYVPNSFYLNIYNLLN